MASRWGKCLRLFLLVCMSLNVVVYPTAALATETANSEETSSSGEGTVAAFSQQVADNIGLNVDAAMAIDAETGQILFDQNAASMHGIASLTKLIAMYVVYDQIAAGNLTMDTKIPVSSEVAALSVAPGLSNIPLEESTDYYTVDNLIDAAIIGSGNAAVVALAEYIGGSEAEFVDMMASKLTELGVQDFELYTASGLAGSWLTTTDGSASPYDVSQENMMQARDILFVAREIVREYPNILDRSNVVSKDFNVNDETVVTLHNTNLFLEGNSYERSDVSGLKTGTEEIAGRCIIITSQIDGRDIMIVTLGADSEAERYENTGNLLNALQENLAFTTLFEEGATWLPAEDVSIYQGTSENVALQYAKTNAMFLPVDYDISSFLTSTYASAFQYDAEGNLVLSAPVLTTEAINTFTSNIAFGETLFNQLDLSNAIVPEQDIEKVSMFVQVSRIMEDLFSGWMDQLQAIF